MYVSINFGNHAVCRIPFLQVQEKVTMDDDWSPPTEEEMKVMEARRARSDLISKLMSGYLLKGYKMLGTECSICGVSVLYN